MNTGTLHPSVGVLGQLGRASATGFGVGPHAIASLAQTQGQKHGAHLGDDATQDDLFPPCRLDRGSEVRVIPGIHLAIASDIWRIWVHVGDFLGEWPIGSPLGRRRQDRRQSKQFAHFRVSHHVVAELCWGVVFDQLQQTQLVIHDQQD